MKSNLSIVGFVLLVLSLAALLGCAWPNGTIGHMASSAQWAILFLLSSTSAIGIICIVSFTR